MKNIPDISFPMTLGRSAPFSLFNLHHCELASKLIEILMGLLHLAIINWNTSTFRMLFKKKKKKSIIKTHFTKKIQITRGYFSIQRVQTSRNKWTNLIQVRYTYTTKWKFCFRKCNIIGLFGEKKKNINKNKINRILVGYKCIYTI